MSEKLNRLFSNHSRFFLLLLLLFSLVMVWQHPALGVVEIIITLLTMLYVLLTGVKQKKHVEATLNQTIRELTEAGKNTMLDSPFPMVVFRPETGEVVWSNDRFLEVTGSREHLSDARLTIAVPDFDAQWLLDGQRICPKEYHVHGQRYMVLGNVNTIRADSGQFLATTYWVDVTNLSRLRDQFYATRPMVCMIVIDNYEELMRNIFDSDRSNVRADIEEHIDRWIKDTGGMLCRYDRDHYLFVVEEQPMLRLKEEKFTILDDVHSVVSPNGISASLSIGIGQGGTFAELFRYASISIEMALSRGGDQAVIKNQYQFEFFGGRSKEQERRTKVKSRVMANALEKLIITSPMVYVMGHRYADLDAMGAAGGVCSIARKKGVEVHLIREEKEVPGMVLVREMEKHKEYEGVFISPEEALERMVPDTLLVVVDTNRPDQVASRPLLDASSKICVIDHHRRAADYIDNAIMNYHEPYASSASELVTELVQYALEPGDLSRVEAEGLLAGIVLDTKNFTLRTGGRTFEAAAFLRRCGADTTDVRKLFQNNLNDTIKRFDLLRRAEFFHEGVAVAYSNEPVNRIIAAQAADELLNVSGVEASFVLYSEEGQINISGRSSGSVNVQVILEALGGGGNGAAAGAQMKDIPMSKALTMLRKSIDKYFTHD